MHAPILCALALFSADANAPFVLPAPEVVFRAQSADCCGGNSSYAPTYAPNFYAPPQPTYSAQPVGFWQPSRTASNVPSPFVAPTGAIALTGANAAAQQPPSVYETAAAPMVAQAPMYQADPFSGVPGQPGFSGAPAVQGWGMPQPAMSWGYNGPLWYPFVEGTGSGGDGREFGQASAFLPLSQSPESLFFADIRGLIGDDTTAEGNWGLGYRHLSPSGWITGIYGYYDLRHTQFNNNFSQGSAGMEWMTADFDARINGYIPEGGFGEASSLNQAINSGGTIVVRQGQERAYYGLDGEIGFLLGRFGNPVSDGELRAFIGGFWFDNNNSGFETIAGPRGRVELRLFDVPWLGIDSRVVLGGEVQYDDVRGVEGTGLVTLRIPLGPQPIRGGRRLNPLERRMVDPIRRDYDIVTNTRLAAPEAALFRDTLLPVGPVTIVDRETADVPGAVTAAPVGNTVIFDGRKGVIEPADTIELQANQTVMGAGFNVVGVDSGAVARFGKRPTVLQNDANVDVFELADGSSLSRMNIRGGRNGVISGVLTDFSLDDNNIDGVAENGVALDGMSGGSITNNTSSNNGGHGFVVAAVNGGEISGNEAEGNGQDGFNLASDIANATVSNNVAKNNVGDGFVMEDILAGSSVVVNESDKNGGHGFRIDNIAGEFNLNKAEGNGDRGFDFVNIAATGEVSGNRANDNGATGFFFDSVAGTFSGNTSTGNAGNGFDFLDIAATGVVDSNTATKNTDNGFLFTDVLGDFTHNVSNSNGTEGFQFGSIAATGAVTGNSAANNAGDGFNFLTVSGIFSQNSATNNDLDGFEFGVVNAGAVLNQNTATSNTGNGFVFGNVAGDFTNNVSSKNTLDGFNFGNIGATGDVVGNTATSNKDDGFEFGNIAAGGVFNNNAANKNTDAGFLGGANAGTATGNTGANNGSNNTYP